MDLYQKTIHRKALIYIIISLCFITTGTLTSQDEGYTDFVIKGSAYINGNHYLSDFTQFPGIENESPGFTSAFGLGGSIGIGAEYIFDEKIFGSNFRYGFQVIYTNMSANYAVEEKIGNNITGNTLGEPYFVEHRLEPSISAILTEHIIAVSPFAGPPVSFLGGFRAGFPISNQFSQEQELTKPAGAEFLEGGTFRYKSSGEIPEASSFYFAVLIGVRYEGYKVGDISFNPEITYSYGLTNMVSSLDWKAGGVMLGISVHYNLPKAVIPPPLPAPLPKLPMPETPPKPKPALLELSIGIRHNNTDIAAGGNVDYVVNIEEYYEDFEFDPVLYYKKDKFVPAEVPPEISSILGMSNQIDILQYTMQYLKENESIDLIIIPYLPGGEDENIIPGRVDFITDKLKLAGLGGRFTVRKARTVNEKFSYEELRDENRKIEFMFSGGSMTVRYRSKNQKKYVSKNVDLVLYADILAEAQPYIYEGRVQPPGRAARVFTDEEYVLSYPPGELLEMSVNDNSVNDNSVNDNKTIIFSAKIEDAESRTIDRSTSANLIAREQIIASYHNINDKALPKSGSSYEQFILGYCRFDRSAFYYVDKDVVDMVKRALQDGKKVQLLALTDNLGTEEHNSSLAQKRVKNALNELMITDSDVEVIIPGSPLFPNASAYGRTLNRSVIIRVLR